ncbi:MAG: twin-arginine translocase TatA/TatE family subunit [Oligoflexia bacterium]|nr:twin-arginine translocase TatA/TatE family subunit [Oligoflexia bacterium]
MGSIGLTEMLLIAGVGLLFLGPSRLPSLGQALGKSIFNFRRGLSRENCELEALSLEQRENIEDK